jgi:hypothetical protein
MFKCAPQSNNKVGWYGTTFQSSYHGLYYSHLFIDLLFLKSSMCGEYGNPILQVPLCPPIFKYNDFDIHEVFFIIPF